MKKCAICGNELSGGVLVETDCLARLRADLARTEAECAEYAEWRMGRIGVEELYAARYELWQTQAAMARTERERDAAVEYLQGNCNTCAFRFDCAKHDNNDSSAGISWFADCEDWQWRDPAQGGKGGGGDAR